MADRIIVERDGAALSGEDVGAEGGTRLSPTSRPGTAKAYARVAYAMVVTDALAVVVAFLVIRLIRFDARPFGGEFPALLVLAPIVWVIVFSLFGLYGLTRLSPAEEFRRLVEASALALAFKLVASEIIGPSRSGGVSGAWITVTWLLALLLVLVGRKLWHRHLGHRRLEGKLLFRTLIVGANDEAIRIAESLHDPALGFLPIGLVRTDYGWTSWDGLPVVGGLHELSRLIEEHGIECVFVASSAVGTDLMKRLAKQLRHQDVEVRVSANLTQILSSRLLVQTVGDLLALSLRPVRFSGPRAAAKRTFDLVVGTVAVLVSAPVWLVISASVKLTSRGPVLFKQERVGQGAKLFRMYKFRTMVHGAEQLLTQLQDRNEATGPLFKMKDDPRVTRVGRWLRKWSLDELPQLLNVLKGDMSLVGPRPALPREVATYEDWHRDRLEVPPGITGLWQVGGRSDLSFDDYVRLDLFYIENWSIAYDLFIIGKTIPAVLLRKGAF